MEMVAQNVKKKTFSSIGLLVIRDLLKQPIAFFTFFFLSVYLQTWELGIYWAVSEIIGFLGYFSDVGLAAALIQKKKLPSKREIRTTFTIQQILVVFLVILSILLTPFLQTKFGFDYTGKKLFYALLFGFFCASLKTIPSVYLERKLNFLKLALVDLVEQIVFSGIAIFLAWNNFGVESWVWAVIGRGIIGVVLIYVLSPWPVGLSFHFKIIKNLFKFGVPYQVNSLLAVFKDRLINIFLWQSIGNTGMGILGWAQKWAQLPLRFLMDSVTRVTFPAYSQIQQNKHRLKNALEKTGFFVNLIIFPVLVGMGLVIPRLIAIYPKYQKWQPAIIVLWFYLINYGFGAATTPLINAFNAVGKIKINLKLMIFWTVLTWLFVPLLATKYGVNGAGFGLMLVSVSSFAAWYFIKKEFEISLFKTILVPAMFAFFMLGGLLFLGRFIPESYLGLAIFVLSGGLIYLIPVLVFRLKELTWFLGTIKSLVKK